MSSPTPSAGGPAGLSESLTALAAVASSAGLDAARARAEGEALSAAVAESAVGAYLDWNTETGRGDGSTGAQAFMAAASRGRKWRSSPSSLLQELVLDGSPQALPYAQALASVSAAAARLGRPHPRITGNATLAAAAQLAALRKPATPGGGLDLPLDAALSPGAFPGLATPLVPATPAAAPPAATASAPMEPEQSPARPLSELLAELDELIGLSDVKAEIHRQVAVLRVEGLRTKAGLKSPTITRHLVFVGNPGTGKTTVARLVGGIYRALGLLSKGQLVEVDRSELVAGYLGQTAIKTAEVVASAAGGVLFVDEAYSLAGDQYGTEAVDTLVKEMEDRRDDLVLIVAGYPDPMAFFIAQNPGLASRFRTTIEFADYSDDELVSIFGSLAEQADYDITAECKARFSAILATTGRGPLFGNGRFARNQLEAAIGRHAWRLRDVAEPTIAQLRELVADDLDYSADEPVEPDAAEPAASEPAEGPSR